MKFIVFQFLIVLLVYFPTFSCQDLQFECIMCSDKFDKCEIDCSWNLQDKNVTDVADCHQDCATQKGNCIDSTEAVKCSKCTLVCAEAYDTDMRKCLSLVSRSTKTTYGSTYSDCQLFASFDMDTCMMKCSSHYRLPSDDQETARRRII